MAKGDISSKTEGLPKNSDLVLDAGKVKLDEPKPWGKGIISEFKKCIIDHWFEEMINFNLKTIAVTLFLFITVISPTLTFGAVYGKSTNNAIGAIETMLATAWVGSAYSVIGVGDPFSQTGLLRYLDPNHKAHEPYIDDPDYNHYEAAFLSIILGFATCWLIFFLRAFKFSAFCPTQSIRSAIHDFAVVTSVVVFTLVKELGFPEIPTETLNVPEAFETTFQCCDASCKTQWPVDCPNQAERFGTRPWIASFGDLNGKGWVPIMAAGPAILAFVLCYLDNGITWHLINHKHNKLEHGEAYNYDLMLNGFFQVVNGILGLPWLVASTVPCIIHLNALAETDKDGNIISVQETRLTLLGSHLLVGVSIVATGVLKLIPLPVLYGVFLFMGLSSLPKIQFWQRFLMFFQQPSKYPNYPFTEWMKPARIHKYTCFQIFFFGLVFFVQNFKTISIIFPLMTLLCIPARLFLLPRFFEGWELCVLDGEEEQIDEWVEAKEESIRNFTEKQNKSNGSEYTAEEDGGSGSEDNV